MSFYLLICDIYFFSWVKYLLKSFALSRNIRLFVSLVLGFESYLHILKTNLCQLCGLRSLSPSLWQIWGLSYRVASWGTERLNNSPRLHGIWRIKIGFNLKSVLFALSCTSCVDTHWARWKQSWIIRWPGLRVILLPFQLRKLQSDPGIATGNLISGISQRSCCLDTENFTAEHLSINGGQALAAF